uniref:CBS domain-containing protein n=1 Tax=Panagrellus redivivus TaxID=6233 RepID=A0A7E4UWC3_PANRE
MIGVLDQSASPDPWNRRRPPGPPPSTPSSMPAAPLDAMDEEIEEAEEVIVHSAQKPPVYRTTQGSNDTKGNNNVVKPANGLTENVNSYYNDTDIIDEDEDDDMEEDYNDDDRNGLISDAGMYSVVDIDDDIIIEGEDPQIREMRQRKRTLSIKLRETVEAFRRLNSTSNGRSSNGWSSSSGGESGETPPTRPPKLAVKAPSQDSAVESDYTRRESIESRREYMRSRRQTITGKWPSAVRRPKMSLNGSLPSQRKTSNDSQFIDDDDDMEPAAVVGARGRRFSVPEKVLIRAHYAILRHEDHELHFLGAFTRQDEPIKHYMQSITCYDVAPGHSAVCILDAALTVRKSVIAYCTTGLAAALVANTANDDNYDIMTLTDCLHIFRAVAKEPTLADLKLKEFYSNHMPNRKKIIYSDSAQTVWDVARMFRVNRVHRIPIMHTDPGKFTGDQSNLMYFLSLRRIFSEVIFKIVDSKCVMSPNLQALTFKDTQIGTWGKIAQLQVPESTPCGEIIDILLERKISCIGLTNEEGFISGIITKQDIMNTVAERRDAPFTETLNIPASKMVSEDCLDFLVTTECTLANAMRTLYQSTLPCLFVVDNRGEFVQGIVSYADIMDFLLKTIEQSRPKMNSSS